MFVNDQDLELLETYLDDELTSEQQELLRRRLSSETELSAAMDMLHDQRHMRQQWLSAVEPGGEEVERLIKSVQKGITRERVWGGRLRVVRAVSAVAACLIIGFLGGYGLRGFGSSTSNAPTAMVSGQMPVTFEQQQPPEPIAFNPLNVGTLSNDIAAPYQIRIVDQSGHVIGIQRFQTADEAQQFRDQFINWQNQHEQLKEGIKAAP